MKKVARVDTKIVSVQNPLSVHGKSCLVDYDYDNPQYVKGGKALKKSWSISYITNIWPYILDDTSLKPISTDQMLFPTATTRPHLKLVISQLYPHHIPIPIQLSGWRKKKHCPHIHPNLTIPKKGMGQNPGTIREPQVIAGLKWMFIPLKCGIYRYWPIPIFPRYFPMVFPRVLTHTHYAISFPRSGREQPSSRVNMVS